MASPLNFEADLTFSVAMPPSEGAVPSLIGGTVRASGTYIDVQCDDVVRISERTTSASLRRTATLLARNGLTLTVSGPRGTLVSIGDVEQRWFDRIVVRSRHIRPGPLREFLRVARSRRRAIRSSAPNMAELLPPPTMFPVMPMFDRVPRRVTTTHGPAGSGGPRLFFSRGPAPWLGDKQRIFYLKDLVTTIGSSPDADLCLAGLDEFQAEIHRSEDDEYLLVPLSERNESTVNGNVGQRLRLRTGAEIKLGSWRMSYYREEYADHGRPHGGRIGGELGHQKSQPRRRYDNG